MSVHLVATVAGAHVAVEEVDAAEARLRDGPGAAALPASDTSEGRQLRRWLTQLIVTERVVAAEAAGRGLTARGAPTEADLLPDVTARLEIGSVAAAALADPRARALFADVTAAVQVTDARCRADIDVCAANTEVLKHLCGRRGDFGGNIAPTAKVVVSVGELDRASSVLPSGVDIGSARQQLVNQI